MTEKFNTAELLAWINKLWLAYQTHESWGIFEGSDYHKGYLIKEYLKKLVQERDWMLDEKI